MEFLICHAAVCLAEGATTWLYAEHLFYRKSPIRRILLQFFLLYGILFGILQLDTPVLNAACFFTGNVLLFRLNYVTSRNGAILHSAFLSAAMSVTEVASVLLIMAWGHNFDAYIRDISIMVAVAVISKLLYLAVSLLGARCFFSKTTGVSPCLTPLFYVFPLLSVVLCVIIAYIGVSGQMAESTRLMMVINTLVLLVSNVIVLILYNHLQKTNAEQLALQLSLQREEADTTYYQALQAQSENQRILIHDIKNHLHTIESLAKSGNCSAIADYLEKLEETLAPAQQIRLCSDPILNMILLQTREDCEEKHIQFHCDVRENCLSFMDAPSITTFYGNLLSNAVEAAERSAERMVELSVTHNPEQAIVLVTMENSCDIAPIPDTHGRFRTNKPGIHGMGLKSIQRVVDKYHGVSSMYYDAENKQFHHIVQFPLP